MITSGEPSGAVTYVAVVGPGDDATAADKAVARRVGRLVAEREAILVCGGLAGVMAAASQGASDVGGLAVGLLPGRDRAAGNRYLSVALPTGLGELRNGLVVGVSDAVIAIGGSWGTLSEIALAMRTGKPTVVIGGWGIDDPLRGRRPDLHHAASAEEAVASVFSMIADARRPGATPRSPSG